MNGDIKQVWSDKYQDYVREDLDEQIEKHTEQGKKTVEICYSCDRWESTTRRCKECGCFMDLKSIIFKLIDKNGACPLKKW